MQNKPKLVMATNNAAKLREARAIAGDKLEILSLDEIGFHNDIAETADTLEGNALIKAHAVKDAYGLNCFADDTGLIVDALDGAPGVFSARYAGEDCNPEKNIDKLLKDLDGVEDRRARFRTCVALTFNGEDHLFDGVAEGEMATHRSGSNGFGYDPIFISAETGKCFAEMSDDEKNAISHRGRAISAMVKWLTTICIFLLAVIPAKATDDFLLFNTFDNNIANVFDTPEKTYFLVQSQMYSPDIPENAEDLYFLFCLDKDTDEIRPYNAQNFLTKSLIRKAYYNAVKNYLLIVYDDYMIDILYDDGKVYSIDGLKTYETSSSKGIRGISFDPELNLAYLATDFGYVSINDKTCQIAASGIYGSPIDRAVRVADHFIILRDGKLLYDRKDSNHFSISDFTPADWPINGEVNDLIALSPSKCIISVKNDGTNLHSLLTFENGKNDPQITALTNLDNSLISENKDGVLFPRFGMIAHVDRETGKMSAILRREEDHNLACGSWDMHEIFFAKPRGGFYSLRHDDNDSWTITREMARPNAPAVFKSTNLLYTKEHGMMVNTHGTRQNFTTTYAYNPILLSGLKNGEWTMYGIPYLDPTYTYRLLNPSGLAQDPDNPDIFYYGSFANGLLRYNIKDMSSLLHITKSDDSPSLPGHVAVQPPYAFWSNPFMLFDPKFDNNGNLIVAHINTSGYNNGYIPEIWIWTAENRKASTSPETFQPFKRLNLKGARALSAADVIPLSGTSTSNMIVYLPINARNAPIAVYDHNGTIENESDDRCVVLDGLFDNDGKVSYYYLYSAVEDPSTGLVWAGTDNGVFTFDPTESFTNPGKVSRIKVNRNDGTSLADYLLSGIAVNNIAIDGKGRKWFSLSGGGLVCTSPDGKSILKEINTENSKLPSDVVYATCFNPDNNSMMVATSAGLCEYYLSSQSEINGSSNVKAYPNPVRHDYYGWVTIEGLEDECIVKITDSAGNLVRELGPASGGRIQWDVCGMDLNRVPSGVYYVLASSGSNGGSYNEATKILVINR